MRLALILAFAPLLLAACVSSPYGPAMPPLPAVSAASPGAGVTTPPPQYRRQLVADPTGATPGTLVVDPANRYLYLVQEDGMALRYGVGVGKAGMEWSGRARVAFKREWPRWTPTRDMIARDPQRYAQWAGGMEGGEGNPLGARALYLFEGGKDTLYRIHGTNEPASIGKAMSSGCIRLMNEDIIDLYNRVPAGASVIVLPVPQAGA
ncbi:putative L,D-transpeptidase ErfK/SrfK [Pleomorphomonas sp. T1.2MG-36]|uniref:L,D-transpeptidase n=1 Tax=Pleomorphomonas sp. T1.2MG-36 TaxID=3041167 RepID=UPI002477B363|nr:L,D-transpeptidase [Pleomorphomonas sp. T1.2MG-36]CAI9408833.1 putative L,D-transpeptidase ErfK/SrfK [Pleomorphomonas sp. T1.2MG-36]